MKKLSSFVITAITFVVLTTMAPRQKAQAQDAMVSYQTFYDELSPYGQWVNDPAYGNVWVPYVEPGFRPYATDGHWAMTDYGNMWISDQPWGWAAYHYGRWTYNGYYGWVWIPGNEWAPAWVNWRYGGGYYGWAPMGPGQVYGGMYDYPSNYWVFVSPDYLYRQHIYRYYERGDMNMYINRTTYLTYDGRGGGDRYYGPRREDIERDSHRPVQVYRVSDAREAGAASMGPRQVNIYRPSIRTDDDHGTRPANIIEGRDHPIGTRQENISPDHENRPHAFREEHDQPRQQDDQRVQRQQRGQQQNQQQGQQRNPQQQQQPEQQRPQPHAQQPQQGTPQQFQQHSQPQQPQPQRPQQPQPQPQRSQQPQSQQQQQQRPQQQQSQQQQQGKLQQQQKPQQQQQQQQQKGHQQQQHDGKR